MFALIRTSGHMMHNGSVGAAVAQDSGGIVGCPGIEKLRVQFLGSPVKEFLGKVLNPKLLLIGSSAPCMAASTSMYECVCDE